MRLSEHLNRLNFAEQILVVKSVLDGAQSCISQIGAPEINVSGFEGTENFLDVAKRIAAASKGKFLTGGATLQERAAGIEIIHKMKALYCDMTRADLPQHLQKELQAVSDNFRTMPQPEFIQIFGSEMIGEGIFKDYKHADGFSIEFETSERKYFILVKETSILAYRDMQNNRRCQ